MEHPINESAWRRGWNDTKKAWASWQVLFLDAVVGVIIGGLFGWGWGLGVVVFGLFCVWVGATTTAPVKQRNEARVLLTSKPKPLTNREKLIEAISHYGMATASVFLAQENSFRDEKNLNNKVMQKFLLGEIEKYTNSSQELTAQCHVAGNDYFRIVHDRLLSFGTDQVLMNRVPGQPTEINAQDFAKTIGTRVSETISQINQISGLTPDK